MHRAAVAGNVDIARLLTSSGANISAGDLDEKTPLDLAASYGHTTLASALRSAGAEGSIAVAESFAFDDLDLEEGEAVVWYLGHSGWAVKTENHLLIFDYWEMSEPPAEPKLANGFITPDEIRDQRVIVFASHDHRDHFDRKILEWEPELDDVTYVFGWQALEDPRYLVTGTRGNVSIGEVEIESVHSEAAGVLEGNFLVRVDGLTIYHSGDYSRSHDTFRTDMEYLAEVSGEIDLFFMLAGDRIDNNEALVALDLIQPRFMYPMHQIGSEYKFELFTNEVSSRDLRTRIFCPENRGDRFEYRNGEVTRIRP